MPGLPRLTGPRGGEKMLDSLDVVWRPRGAG
jgi:hypothetical protein